MSGAAVVDLQRVRAGRKSAASLKALRARAEAAVERLLAILDALDGDTDLELEPDLEITCEDEGAQCEDEGAVDDDTGADDQGDAWVSSLTNSQPAIQP